MLKEEGYDAFLAERIAEAIAAAERGEAMSLEEWKKHTDELLRRKALELDALTREEELELGYVS
ncbi:hypothetical protein L5B97_11815 [Avibacterium sp. 20-15]|uniref:hypothetical protein n=1 Tax=unclassified Avibacterium TaxID=2685287 RepID=UPI0020268217|nr:MULTISPECIES: hypothetical protein [unclassified Avibacterium]MCW9734143.1 hypothetical protein [Avibacterium sp. 20-15]URL03782.1 hypothetical protein L4F93_09470 [Avibacterium sp. 20-132]